MKILIDTHILLWALSEPEKLPESYRNELESQANRVFVSAVSIAEIMIKQSIGKLTIEENLIKIIEESQFEFLDFSPVAASLLKDLPFHHKDPFDRMLISQVIEYGLVFMTMDEKIRKYDCRIFNA